MKIRPLGPRVLLKPIKEEEQTAGGIYIPEEAREKKKQGIVEAAGTDKNGKPLPLEKGDTVLYGGYSSEEFELDGEEYLIIEYKDILAKLGE